jgi:hypothetical protein
LRRPRHSASSEKAKASSSFFEKKEPKKLSPLCARRVVTCVPKRQHPQMDKSFFASFFSKKEDPSFP